MDAYRYAVHCGNAAPPIDIATRCAAVRVKLRRNYPLKTSEWLYGEDLSGLSWAHRVARLNEFLLSAWQRRWDNPEENGVTPRLICTQRNMRNPSIETRHVK